jgi:hypothetical protein
MNLRLDPHAELRSLVEALCEETITAPQMERLEALVAADPDAEAFYITYLHMQACLVREFGATTPQFGDGGQGPPGSVEGGAGGPAPVAVPDVRPVRGRRSVRLGYVAAALALAATVGLAGAWVGRLTGPRPVAGPAEPVLGGIYPKVDFARGLAMVVKLDRIEWEPDDGPRPAEGDLLPQGRFRFRSGRATLSMLTGVALVVEGPADLELLSHEKIFCHRGKLRARVPEGAEGFVVSGSGSAVVDLGTEFGMNVELDGTMRGRVFEGRVEAAVLNESGTIQRSRMMRSKSNIFAIDPRNGQIEAGPGPEEFVAASDVVAPPLMLDPGYKSAVLTSRPWAYWRFDEVADGSVPNEIPGRPPLRITGPIRLSEPSAGNRSAVFGAGKTMQYLSMDRPWKAARRPGYAVELWFLSEVIGHAALVSMTVPANTNFHQFLLELTSKDRGSLLHQPASIRFLHRCPPGTGGGDNLYSHNLYVPFRWHHVVGQMNGDRMELFMDGEPTPPLSVDPDDVDEPGQFLLGRLTAVNKSDHIWNRPLIGQMDEVALYDRPLTIEEIRAHYRLGAQVSRTD